MPIVDWKLITSLGSRLSWLGGSAVLSVFSRYPRSSSRYALGQLQPEETFTDVTSDLEFVCIRFLLEKCQFYLRVRLKVAKYLFLS